MDDYATILKMLAEELYHRAAAAQTRDERKAIKGVQHSIERVLERLGQKASFERSAPGPQARALHNVTEPQP